MEPRPRPALPEGPYLVVGLGVAGLAVSRALADRSGPTSVAAWTRTVAAPYAAAVDDLRERGVEVHVGGDGLGLLVGRPCVVKSPGVPDDQPLIAAARERGLELVDEAEVGWRLDRRPFVGVTGTNGKSTVCSLVAAASVAAGRRAIVAGNSEGGPALSSLAQDDGVDLVVAELSSFQLRHSPALLPEVAVLTNCTHDSWQRHGGREGYERDKARIAVRDGVAAAHAVLPADDPLGRRLEPVVRASGGEVTTFGFAEDADCRVAGCDWTLDGSRLAIDLRGRALELDTRLPGRHNALNVAAALAAAAALGIPTETACTALAAAAPVPGRLERVSVDAPFDVLVDYAHNPDGIERVLATVRHVLDGRGRGRLVTVGSALPVFDDGQYEAMGRALGHGADHVVATTERLDERAPLEEPPAFFAGLRSATAAIDVEIDRGAAIRRAVELAEPDDVVLVLGRGRRLTPIHRPDGTAVRIDDREQARVALNERLDR